MTAEVNLSVWNILASFFIFFRGGDDAGRKNTTIKKNKLTSPSIKFRKKKNGAAGFVKVASGRFVIRCCDIKRWTFVVKQTGSGVQQETRPEEALFSGAPNQTAAFMH